MSSLADGTDESPDENHEDAALEVVRARLHRDHDGVVGPEEVERALDAARRRFDGSRIRTFVPIFVERHAVAEIRAAAADREHRQAASPDG